MPVCIAGMHRSGTSMVARLLNLCGLYLGPQDELLPQAPDNPTGFWEHTGFLEINDQLLAHLGGLWNAPPATFPSGWATSPELTPFVEKAHHLLQNFTGQDWWGWKDPRTSLTYPFWQRLIPDLKIVICLRSPLEVDGSLKQREVAGLLDTERDWVEAPYKLWEQYYRQAWQDAPPERRIITHYESFFVDPVAELRRLLVFLEMPLQPEQFEPVLETVQKKLYRQRYSVDQLIVSDLPLDTLQLYLELSQAAGPVYEQSKSAQAFVDVKAQAASLLNSLKPVTLAVLQTRANAFRYQEEQLNQHRVEAARLQRQLVDRETTMKMLYGELDQRAETIHALTRQIAILENWKFEVTSRFSWQMLEKFWALRERIAPKGRGVDRILSPLLAKFKRKSGDNFDATSGMEN